MAVLPSRLTATQDQGPAETTATTLAETGARPGGVVTFTATVTGEARAAHLPVPAGTVSFYRNGASRPLGVAASDPLDLGTLAVDPSGTFFSASVPLDPGSSDVTTAGSGPAGPAFNGITVVDTQASNLPWSITAWASDLGDGGDSALSLISGENVGLTGLTAVPVPGSSVTASDLTFFDQPAADPPVGPADTGSLGLGGQVAHVIITDAGQAEGTIGINGTITINAPTSTQAGTFGGAIVLTLSNGTPSG